MKQAQIATGIINEAQNYDFVIYIDFIHPFGFGPSLPMRISNKSRGSAVIRGSQIAYPYRDYGDGIFSVSPLLCMNDEWRR